MDIKKDLEMIRLQGIDFFMDSIRQREIELEKRHHLGIVLNFVEQCEQFLKKSHNLGSLTLWMMANQDNNLEIRVFLRDKNGNKHNYDDSGQTYIHNRLPAFSFFQDHFTNIANLTIENFDKNILAQRRYTITLDDNFRDVILNLFLSQELKSIYLMNCLDEKLPHTNESTHQIKSKL